MKSLPLFGAVLAFTALSTLVSPARAEPTIATRLWLNGDSTVRKFRCDAKNVSAKIAGVDRITRLDELQSATVAGRVQVLVANLDCANTKMNEHMRDALKMREHPRVEIQISNLQLLTRTADSARLSANGALTIAGQTRPIVLELTARPATGAVVITGEYTLLMTDYGVTPPTLMLGTLRVHDPITVGFEVTVPAPAQTSSM